MRKFIPKKLVAFLLLMVMLSVASHGIHESCHAGENTIPSAKGQLATTDSALAPHHCPCSPVEQHGDGDGCDSCLNCSCHAPLTGKPLQLNYNPAILYLSSYDPFKHIPEVYLSKFIPPQIPA